MMIIYTEKEKATEESQPPIERDNDYNDYGENPSTSASGLVTIFPENPEKLCNTGATDSKKIDDEVVAIIDKLSEFKCITATQQENILIKFTLI